MSSPIVDENLEPKYRQGFRGVLEKRGHFFKNWKERYFTLTPEDRSMKYYADSSLTQLKGDHSLKENTSISIVGEFEGHKNVILIKTGEEELYFSAKDAPLCQEWYDALMECSRGGFPWVTQAAIWGTGFAPRANMFVRFGTGAIKPNGNMSKSTITAQETAAAPNISFSVPDQSSYFTLVAFSPDYISDKDLTQTSTMFSWVVVNIPGNQSSSGDEVSRAIVIVLVRVFLLDC